MLSYGSFMIFTATRVQGAFLIDMKRIEDERGFFARAWCRQEFVEHGLNPAVEQCNVSFNVEAGTLRGLHYQRAPHAEAKLVRCTGGAIFDVAVDLRPNSPTYRQWIGAELTSTNRRMLYIPEGCAHGYLTLAPDTEVFYQVSVPYAAAAADGVRWNDPAFGVQWPVEPRVILPRDAQYPDFRL
jgi:dTDP-4-dehydrorhamnose 3,5-epimerase